MFNICIYANLLFQLEFYKRNREYLAARSLNINVRVNKDIYNAHITIKYFYLPN